MKLISFAAISLLAITVSAYPPRGAGAQRGHQPRGAGAQHGYQPPGAGAQHGYQPPGATARRGHQHQNTGAPSGHQHQSAVTQRGHRPQGAASQRAQGHQLQLLQEERDRLEDRYNQNQDVVNDLQFAIDVAERGRFGIRSLIRYLYRSGASDSLLNLIRMHGSLNMVKETKKSLERSIVTIKEELRALG
ncbi:hypothetical protein BASA61_006728 [Batrachochytrium salamandrivorans]|nr:hypothetical protein BASA60_009561 [Batrachochytrium salamandrivorans]KAH6585801.1 hypothetical protein BASA61_006728 [Batrachochytrium salamandrivorans]